MSFVATDPVIPPGEEPGDNGEKIISGAFWPEVELYALRLSVGLDGTVTAQRLMAKASEAVAYVNDQLFVWRESCEAQGFTRLADVPADTINNISVKVQRWQYAVASMTKALLIEGYRNIDTTREGEKHAEALSTQIDTLWRDTYWALRDITGAPRGTVELV